MDFRFFVFLVLVCGCIDSGLEAPSSTSNLDLVVDDNVVDMDFCSDLTGGVKNLCVDNLGFKRDVVFADALELGDTYFIAEDYLEAISAYSLALALDDKSTEMWIGVCDSYVLVDDYSSAYDFCLTASQMTSSNSIPLYNLGMIYFSQGKSFKSIEIFDSAIDMGLGDNLIWSGKCYVLNEIENFTEALKACKNAVNKGGVDSVLFNNLAYSLYALENYELALDYYNQSLSLDSLDEVTWKNKALVYIELEDFDLALEAVDESIKINKKYSSAQYIKGYILLQKGEIGDGKLHLEKAVELEGDNPYLWSDIGYDYIEIGELHSSKHAFEKSLELDDTQVDTWIAYGDLLSIYFEAEDAKTAYMTALELEPNNEYALDALVNLA